MYLKFWSVINSPMEFCSPNVLISFSNEWRNEVEGNGSAEILLDR